MVEIMFICYIFNTLFFSCHIWCDWTKDHAEKYWESGSKILSEKDREYIQEDILEYFPAPAKTVMSNE